MYKEMYDRWLAADLADADLKPELESVKDDDAAIQDRFAVALKFGTAGLRGVIGAGTNRMNIYVVRQATQGLANWVKTQGGSQTVAISYDSRIKSDVFAKTAAEVLAANGIKVRIYSALMPVPALSFATRYYNCNAGIMVTASHNPAKYNGYKAYGPDGCQMTDEAADIVYAEIQKTDILTGAKLISFEDGMAHNLAGARLGYCIARPGLITDMNRVKFSYSPYNVNSMTQAAGTAAIRDEAYFHEVTAKLLATRTAATKGLRQRGFTVFDSAANFLFATTDRMPCKEIFEKLRAQGILIRHFNAPRISNYLRITIGTDAEMQRFFAALDEILGA